MKLKKAIREFLSYQKLKGQRAASTIENYNHYLKVFLSFAGDIKVTEINLDLIDNFQKYLLEKKGLKQATACYHLVSLRVLLKYLSIRKDINCLNWQKVELPEVEKKILPALTEKEEERLLLAAKPNKKRRLRDRAILQLLLSSGIRVSELTNLKIKDVDFNNRRFTVTGKGNKQRVCFFDKKTAHFLQRHLKERKQQDSKLLFCGQNSSLTPRTIQRTIKKYAKKARIREKVVTTHTLRRTFGARMLRHGVDTRHIQRFLGHKTIVTTQLYTNIEQPELQNIYSKANSSMVKNAPGGIKNEFVLLSKDNFYKITGAISANRALLKRLCKKVGA